MRRSIGQAKNTISIREDRSKKSQENSSEMKKDIKQKTK